MKCEGENAPLRGGVVRQLGQNLEPVLLDDAE